MKLTNEEIARVFAGYIGSEATYNNKINNHQGKILGVDAVGNVILSHKSVLVPYKVCDIGYSSMLLTPLSSITDEHAIEVAKMRGIEKPKIKRTINLIKIIGHNATLSISYLEMEIHLMANTYNCTNTMDVVNIREYLKSKGYDVPMWFGIDHHANGKTAIELGVAIDKTKTNLV